MGVKTVFCAELFAGEVIDRNWVLEERIVAGDYGDAAVGNEVTRAVGFGVIEDLPAKLLQELAGRGSTLFSAREILSRILIFVCYLIDPSKS